MIALLGAYLTWTIIGIFLLYDVRFSSSVLLAHYGLLRPPGLYNGVDNASPDHLSFFFGLQISLVKGEGGIPG